MPLIFGLVILIFAAWMNGYNRGCRDERRKQIKDGTNSPSRPPDR